MKPPITIDAALCDRELLVPGSMVTQARGPHGWLFCAPHLA
jgi:hypothetical protein